MVPQYGGLIHDLSMLDNSIIAEIHIKQRELREQKINKIVSQFEFEALLNIKAKHLSGGQKTCYCYGINKFQNIIIR